MTDDYLDNIRYLNFQRCLDLVIEYREDIGDPCPAWPKEDFDRVSYSRFAVDEIISLLMKNSHKTVCQVLEEFKYEMGLGCSKYIRNHENEKIFTYGYSVAVDLLDRLSAMGEI